ncbi:MAG TPA: diacylglycerol kinase family protein [Stellaceae bacterium]|nr:diacylglycerol kinase family protein [Stellaceae bacterium]
MKVRRILAIYNPTAGQRARGTFERFRAALTRLGAKVTIAETERAMHARELAAAADPARFDAVAVAGGDGTINEAVNGIVHSGLPLAILPLGTANVLANELNLPRDAEALAEIAALNPPRSIVPAEITSAERNEPWRFLLMAGIGFDAEVVAHLDLKLKRRIGKAAYALGSIAQLARHERRNFATWIDGKAETPAALVVARAHFYGGRFVLAPQARLDEPALHAVLFPASSRLAALRYMAGVVTGTLARQCDVEVRRAAAIDLAGPEGAPVQIDGDVRAHLPASIRLAATPLAIIA